MINGDKGLDKVTPKEVADFHRRSDVDSGPSALHHTLGYDVNQAAPGTVVKAVEERVGYIEKQLDIVSGRPSTLGSVRRLNTEMQNTITYLNSVYYQVQTLQNQMTDVIADLNQAIIDVNDAEARIEQVVNIINPPPGTLRYTISNNVGTNWLICDGRTFNTTTFTDLAYLLGTNTTPDLRSLFIKGASTMTASGVASGGSGSITIGSNNLPHHNHPLTIDAAGNHSHGLLFSENPGNSSQHVPRGTSTQLVQNSNPVNSNGEHTHSGFVGSNTTTNTPISIDPSHYKVIIAIKGRW